MFYAIFLGLYSSSSYNKGRLVFGILRYLINIRAEAEAINNAKSK